MKSKVFGAAMLIAGTCIGAVTIVMPLSLMSLGSKGVLLMLLLTAVLVYYPGLLIFEVSKRFPVGTSLAQMASELLGSWVGCVVQMLFLLLLYCLLSAYMTGGSALISDAGHGILLWIVFGVLFLMLTVTVQDALNRLLLFLLGLSYITFVGFAGSHISVSRSTSMPFTEFWPSVSVLATAFGYHVIIPSIRDYIGNNSSAHKQALLIGLSIPFIIYLVWCFTLYGILPYQDAISLSLKQNSYVHVIDYLQHLVTNKFMPVSLLAFMLVSIASSYVGIAISLSQAISRKITGKILRAVLVILPPAAFTVLQPGGFLLALRYASIIVAIISLILPVVMAYVVRQQRDENSVIGCFSMFIIVCYASLIIFSGWL